MEYTGVQVDSVVFALKYAVYVYPEMLTFASFPPETSVCMCILRIHVFICVVYVHVLVVC